MLLGILEANLLGNMLASKGFIRAGEGTARVGYGSKNLQLNSNQILEIICLIKQKIGHM